MSLANSFIVNIILQVKGEKQKIHFNKELKLHIVIYGKFEDM